MAFSLVPIGLKFLFWAATEAAMYRKSFELDDPGSVQTFSCM